MASKIEPYDVDDIRELVQTFGLPEILAPGALPDWHGRRLSRMILAWAHERALATQLVYIGRHSDCEDVCFFDDVEDCVDGDHDWLGAVLDEIGWLEEKR